MSKMGKFLASKKGKANVKASADTALQQMLAAEMTADQKMHEAIQAIKVTKVEAEEWGAEDSDDDGVGAAGVVTSGVLGGGHFHLISEEDVAKKKGTKVVKKWGGGGATATSSMEEKAVVEDQKQAAPPDVGAVVSETPPAEKQIPATAAVAAPPLRYVPKKGRPLGPKINIQDSSAFPSLDLDAATSSSAAAPMEREPQQQPPAPQEKKKERKKPEKRVDDEGHVHQETAASDSPVLMSVEQFLQGVVVETNSVGFSDDKTRQKFVGRRRRPVARLQEAV